MAQLSVQRNFDEAYAGLKGDLRPDTVESFLSEGTIKFGIGVVAGTDVERQVKTPAAVTDTFRGIAIHQHIPQVLGTGIAQYPDKDAVSTLRKGVAWMPIETSQINTIAVDDAVYINVAIGGAELGKATGVSIGNIATGGTARKVNAGLGLVLVEIDL